ncbi:GNAT family N-acetyltransferase [Vagococcus sp. BWB3-3]|uniref:GNAT family N-acetyltransferase n=1 Tax=Vagococcus allomyrinae TaxID=2794353 RepID=A0A940PDU1_9ENTE|nr:GNAT family N-acetyltransferase [Vagococcus allomyrinae]MBP1044206.1 GNAT family N-acetyltransferase [Vagococcus allomyrinae]
MVQINLVEPTTHHQKAITAFKEAFPAGQKEIQGSSELVAAGDIGKWLDQIVKNKQWETIQDGWVPGIQYLAINQQAIVVGMLSLRLSLNDYLFNYGGHIGYSVRPDQRNKGYASEMLKLALTEAKGLGLANVLVTCADDNHASAKVIENNHGRLADKRVDQQEQKIIRRYWLTC